jgi:SagB-type dehydrogenase family enzyme
MWGVVTTEAGRAARELDAGIYHYEVDSHILSLHRRADVRPELARAALNQGFIVDAPVDITICALFHRTSSRYGRRAGRYVHIEVGNVSENIRLQAVALGLASLEVGAFDERR